jgi:hypothetical protein
MIIKNIFFKVKEYRNIYRASANQKKAGADQRATVEQGT